MIFLYQIVLASQAPENKRALWLHPTKDGYVEPYVYNNGSWNQFLCQEIFNGNVSEIGNYQDAFTIRAKDEKVFVTDSKGEKEEIAFISELTHLATPEGGITTRKGNNNSKAEFAISEGTNTSALGKASHSEGDTTVSKGWASHAEGFCTETSNNFEHAQGYYNKSNTGSLDANKTLHSIGFGTGTLRKNAQEVMCNGDFYIFGVGGYEGYFRPGASSLSIQTVINRKQDKSDASLTTTNKTVVGGINELKATIESLTKTVSALKNKIQALESESLNETTK